MKKIISLILAVLMIFSVTAVAAFAEGETEAQKPIRITFIYDDADINGIAVPKTKEIYVDYGEDYNSRVPEGSYRVKGEDGKTYRIYTDVWSSDKAGYDTTLFEKGKFPVFGANDNVSEIVFKAEMASEEVTVGGVIEDAAEGILGESTVNFFNYIIEQLKLWFGKLILYIRNFM